MDGSGRAPLNRAGRGQKSRVPPGGVGRTGGDGVLSSSWRKPQAQRGGEGTGSHVLGGPSHYAPPPPGEPYITIKAYTAVLEDEISLEEGEAIEVIHKLLDGWWVIR